jgi:hypothetical protein
MGKIVYLPGSHTQNTLQDWGSSDPPPGFDYEKYLTWINTCANYEKLKEGCVA